MDRRLLAACLTCLCAACGTQPSPAETTPASAPAASVDANGGTPVQSGAAVFDCDALVIAVASGEAAVRIGVPPDRTLVLRQTPAASGARYSDGADVFWNRGADATFTLDGRTYTCREARDPWHDARARGIDVRAVGQEPGWYLEIDRGETLRLVYDYGSAEAIAPAPEPVVTEGRTTYTAQAGDDILHVTIDDRLCQDGMSGQPFSHTVTVGLGERVLRGCGRSLEPPPDGWTAAPRGVGPIRIGMTRAQADAPLQAPLEGPDEGACVYLRSSALPEGVRVMQVGGVLVRVDVTAPGVPTDAGVEVGASERHVHAAYGPGVTVSPHKYTDGRYLTIARDGHAIVFETDGEWITEYRVGRVPEVEWVEGCS